ncbi:MAG: bacteriohemerythrin [Treponema sp.]|jgi:hemerythrin|nr:bacteriohemerythrin [Treponema sp.]
MTDDNIVVWHNSYSIGIPLIDEQHKELIRLTNQLFASCVAGRESSKASFMETIRGAVDYIGYHFSTEEKVMERVNYPDYLSHKKEHTKFVKEVLIEVDDFKSGRSFVPNAFVHFLKNWVLAHIAVCDKKLGEYLINLKKSGSLQGITLRVKQEANGQRLVIR